MENPSALGRKERIDRQATESKLARVARVEKKAPSYDAAETRRRILIRHTAAQARNLDLDFATLPRRDLGQLSDFVERIETLEALSLKKPDRIESVGQPGMNSIERHVFGEQAAYVKGQTGEALFKLKEGTTSIVLKYEWNDKRKQWVEGDVADLNLSAVAFIAETDERRDHYVHEVADYYGIDPSEVTLLKPKGIPLRIGIEAGRGPVNEYGVSRVDQLLGFDVVPLTVIRQSADGTDLLSVQEAVASADTAKPARELMPEDFAELLRLGPAHPAAKSLMRIAALHELVGASDGHTGNVLYDPTAQRFWAIDNGLSFGLSRITSDGREEPLDHLISIPIEVINKFPQWKLDDETVENLQRIYDSLVAYSALRRRETETLEEVHGLELEKVKKGKEARFLSDLFKLIYSHDKIADKELGSFLVRLKKIITNKRPSPNPVHMRRLEPLLNLTP